VGGISAILRYSRIATNECMHETENLQAWANENPQLRLLAFSASHLSALGNQPKALSSVCQWVKDSRLETQKWRSALWLLSNPCWIMQVKDNCDLIFYRALSLPRDKAETPTVLLWFVIPRLRRIRKEFPPQSLSLSLSPPGAAAKLLIEISYCD
jgi:hypothetical protein